MSKKLDNTRTLYNLMEDTNWIKELDNYNQGQLGLKLLENKYCCLGVLCEVTKNSVVGRWKLNKGTKRYTFTSTIKDGWHHDAYLPKEIDLYQPLNLTFRDYYKSLYNKVFSFVSNIELGEDLYEDDKISTFLARVNDDNLDNFETIKGILIVIKKECKRILNEKDK